MSFNLCSIGPFIQTFLHFRSLGFCLLPSDAFGLAYLHSISFTILSMNHILIKKKKIFSYFPSAIFFEKYSLLLHGNLMSVKSFRKCL